MLRVYKVLDIDEESKAFAAKNFADCKTEDGRWNGKFGRCVCLQPPLVAAAALCLRPPPYASKAPPPYPHEMGIDVWMMSRSVEGRYPPALDQVIAKGKNFQQLEDFNKKKSGED